MNDGTKLEMDYFLDYDLPPDRGTNYVQVESPATETTWEPPQ